MTGPATLLADATADRAERLARQGDHPAARAVAREALAQAAPDSLLAGRLINLLGGIAFELGELDEAERRFEVAMAWARARGEAHLLARAATNLASVVHLRGKETLAVTLYASAYAVFQGLEDPVGVARTCHNLGVLAREAGRWQEALSWSERAVAAAEEAPETELEGQARAGFAAAALGLGRLGVAREQVRRAGRLAERSGDRIGAAEVARLTGELELASGYPGAGLAAAREAWRGAHRLGCTQVSAEAAELAARCCQALHRARQARRFRALASARFSALGAAPALRRLAVASGG
ncbi:MAG: tetratricopeptide repeat protein [Gemmatimonadetes bacterium]|nr:tetratricopeptide repeat protein [Gemmatimonadota bacterium]